MTLSLCMIVKNEEETLARCLESAAAFADEIVIVDTGSTDRTAQIARAYTDLVYSFPWVNDFAAARNFSFSKGTMDYLMWLDADDVVPPTSQEALKALKSSLTPDVSMVMLPYHTAFDEAGRPALSYYRERLIRNGQGFLWEGAVHEAVTPRGNVITKDIPIEHRKVKPGDPDRNLRILTGLIAAGVPLSPRQRYYYSRELYDHERYEEAAGTLEAFLREGQGWVENNIDACLILSRCREQLGQEALSPLFESFHFDVPRPEIACRIGEILMGKGRFQEAAFWYETALQTPRKNTTGAFVRPEYQGYIPCLQLCVCYDRLGEYALAKEYNDRAAALKPDSPACRQNAAYFAARLKSQP